MAATRDVEKDSSGNGKTAKKEFVIEEESKTFISKEQVRKIVHSFHGMDFEEASQLLISNKGKVLSAIHDSVQALIFLCRHNDIPKDILEMISVSLDPNSCRIRYDSDENLVFESYIGTERRRLCFEIPAPLSYYIFDELYEEFYEGFLLLAACMSVPKDLSKNVLEDRIRRANIELNFLHSKMKAVDALLASSEIDFLKFILK